MGWLTAIVVGGLAGWLAGIMMNMRFGVLMNIFIGIVGAVVASAIFDRAGIYVASGWLGFLVTGFIGSCVLLLLAKIARN